MHQSPLHNEHLALKAKMVPFGGWDMPVQYDGILAEHAATRKNCAMFDTSHMGEFFVDGDAVASGLDHLVSQTIADMSLGTCRYGFLLNERGTVVDDLIVYRLAEEKWMIVVNAGTMDNDARLFSAGITDKGRFLNGSSFLGKLDVQGPDSRDILRPFVPGIDQLEYYTFFEATVLGEKVVVSRTGYTGELGYEIYFPWNKMTQLWRELLSRGVKPAGLGARDLLRTEMALPLYGHELSEDISPLSVGLGRFIDWNKDFVGKAALLKQKEAGVREKMICLVSESRRSLRAGHPIFSLDEKNIGTVTSGTFSPAFQKGVGLGIVTIERLGGAAAVYFGEGRERTRAEIVTRPIYKNGTAKK